MVEVMLPDPSRRRFLKTVSAAGMMTIVGSTTSALINPLTAWAVPGGNDDTVLVSIFLRGAADGLNIVCPHGDPSYYTQRGDYGVGAGQFTDLDGFFGLSNDFAALAPYYSEGRMALVQAVGSHLPTRSHFVAQPNMESGLGLGGWLQRSVAASSFAGSAAGLSIGDRTSPQLVGPFSGTTVKTVDQAVESGMNIAAIRPAIEGLYGAAGVPDLEKTAVLGALTTIDQIASLTPMPGEYPNTPEARNFREAASLITADIGVRAVALESTGWDHHSDGIDRMSRLGGRLSAAIQAFLDDLGSHRQRVVVLVSTEFGRTVKPNGSGGTDHGHGNLMMVFGDRLDGHGGGQVLTPGGWPGLADADLYQGRDLAVTTDFRSVYAELAQRHLGVTDLSTVFPGFTPEPVGLLPAAASGDVDGSGTVDNADVQSLLESNVHGTAASNADIDGDGDADLRDALLLAQQIDG